MDGSPPQVAAGPVITSSPQSGDTYGMGEAIEVSVTFSETVTVTGEPQVRLAVGERQRRARYDRSGQDGTILVFAYKVKKVDADEDGVGIGADQLMLNGGSIADGAGNAADLSAPALPDQAGHKVDGSPEESEPPSAPNNAPVFSPDAATRSVPENSAAGTAVGAALPVATDGDGDALSYSMTATGDGALFNFDTSTRQITVKTSNTLDHETRDTYTVTVTAGDGNGGSGALTVTITVADVAEPPGAPTGLTAAPVSGSTTSLRVTWTAPDNAGRPAITGYDVQYKLASASTWSDGPQDVAVLTADVSSLTAGTAYQARVRAANDEGDGPWSDAVGGTTNAPVNVAPVFSPGAATRSVPENSAAGTAVGAALPVATDGDGDALSYSMTATGDGALFNFDTSTRQITVKTSNTLDHETRDTYTVTVTAGDGNGGSGALTVTITVADVAEPPGAPTGLTAAPVSGSTTSLRVTWTAPDNAGRPAITGYDVQYKLASASTWSDGPQDVAVLTADVSSLTAGTAYQARVRAANDEGDGPWSDAVGGTTNAPVNVAPVFSSSSTVSVEENQTTVTTVAATDADDDDNITGYAITGGADRAKFSVVQATGVLTFQAAPDFEDPQDADADNVYNVTVQATGGANARAKTATLDISVTVTNVEEAGRVTFGSAAPQEGVALEAELSDPDVVQSSPAVTWAWERLAAANAPSGTSIPGAASARYTPVAADVGQWLRATASYTDAHGSGKSARATTTSQVAAAVRGQPALRFTQTEFRMHPRTFIWSRGLNEKNRAKYAMASPTAPQAFFDQVVVETRSGATSGLRYAVEALPDKSTHQYCIFRDGKNTCLDAEIGVGEQNGYLFARTEKPCYWCNARYTSGYPTQRIELSVSAGESAPGLKVYREALVKAPDSTPDCSDFPHKNVDRFTCLFLHEMLPDELPTTTAALRNGLPNLVQPKANYNLIFAEEFNGNLGQKLPAEGCHNGLATLDNDLWQYQDPCPAANPETQEPCLNVEDGHFYMAITAICKGEISTEGLFAYKYGYLEVKYRVNFKNGNWGWSNHAMVVGNPGLPGLREWRTYNVPMNDFEDFSKYIETELDVFEWNPVNQSDVSGQYKNWYKNVKSRDAAPGYSQKAYYFCKRVYYQPHAIEFMGADFCAQTHVTLTKGFEWTPRGFRYFLKVDGVHDDFITISKKNTRIQSASVSGRGDNLQYGWVSTIRGSAHDAFFEFLDPTDDGSILEQLSIAHRPLILWLVAHGGPPRNRDVRTKMEVDYIRIYQPADRYMDMEPVYK